MNKEQLRTRIINSLKNMQAEFQQIVNDKERWNQNRNDAEPFDIGWDRLMLQATNKQLEAWKEDDMEKMNTWANKMNELQRNLPE